MFISEALKFIEVPISHPIEINMVYMLAIFLSKSGPCTTIWTKHINIQYHFISEHVENGKIKIKFVDSEGNTEYIMTKNLSGELFHKHKINLV
jgi:hypothetical protein